VQQASNMGATAPNSAAIVPVPQSDMEATAAPGTTEYLQIMAAALASVQRRYLNTSTYAISSFAFVMQLNLSHSCFAAC